MTNRLQELGTRPPAIEADGLVKLFGTTPALLKLDLAVAAGTVCALVGENGAGKTTLLRVLATALRPSGGSARVCGFDVATEARRVRPLVDLLSASGGAYPELSCIENLGFAVSMRGLSPARGEIERALGRAGLAREADVPARALSGGMLRRLALARLLLTRPPVLLVDEPYASLDESGRELVDELLRVARTEARTALVATHERLRIRPLADRVLVLRTGERLAEETSEPAPTLAPVPAEATL